MKFIVHIVVVITALGVAAQEPIRYTRFLLPLKPGTVSGAFGATWRTQTWVFYGGTEEAEVRPVLNCCCSGICPTGTPIPPGLPPFEVDPTFTPTVPLLVHVDRRYADAFTFSSRVQDVARNPDAAGTDVPVVHEERFIGGPLRLLDVPIDAGFRTMLRVYALPEVMNPEAEVRYYRQPARGGGPIEPDRVLLRTDRVALRWFAPTPSDLLAGIAGLTPSYIEIPEVQALAGVGGEDALWIEIQPLTAGARIWAFASVTNNATQQVTLITP